MLVIYGFSLHLSHFSNNRSGGWGASNKHSLLSITPLNRIHSCSMTIFWILVHHIANDVAANLQQKAAAKIEMPKKVSDINEVTQSRSMK